MSDRDIPSVPITTLAGLTSLSDLLSELPVSGSISSITSLNKSLLFHTLVAEESNNLLSVRDDNLVKQLVHAIEQTNSDHIELKSEYAINQPSTNISEYPVLLQGIYTFKPTVFNTPHSHRIQNHHAVNMNPSNLYHHQVHQQQQQQKVPGNSILQNQTDVIVQQIQTQQHFNMTQPHNSQISNSQNVNNTSSIEYATLKDPKKRNQQQPISSPVHHAANTSQATVINMNNSFHNVEMPIKKSTTRRQTINDRQVQQHQLTQPQQLQQVQQQQLQQQLQQKQQLHHQQQVQHPQQLQQDVIQQQAILHPQHQIQSPNIQQNILNQQQSQLQKTVPQQINTSQLVHHQRTQPQITHQVLLQGGQLISQASISQQSSVPQPHKPISHQSGIVQQNTTVQQTPIVQKVVQQQQQIVVQQNPNVHQIPVQNRVIQQNVGIQKNRTTVSVQQNVLMQQNRLATSHNIGGQQICNVQNPVLTTQQQQPQQQQQQNFVPLKQNQQQEQPQHLHQQQQQQQQSQQCLHHQQQQMPIQQQQIQLQQQQMPIQQQQIQLQQQQQLQMQQSPLPQQKTIPRNNEYLEQQSKHFDLRGPSPAQASIAPESNQIGTPRQISQKQIINQNKLSSDTLNKTGSLDGEHVSSASSSIDMNLSTTSPSTKLEGGNVPMKPKVCLNRLKAEDEVLMQQSLKKFAKKSPELARKLGLTELPSPMKIESETVPLKNDDTFSQMKADERKCASKRKCLISSDEISAEQIFTKPKLRKIERSLIPMLPKSTKDELMKSQTYQQFMRNMEQIIEQLDDTDSPNFNSDDTDENIECISSKMLTVMSNDVAKLKAKGVLDSVPKNKLTLLINYAMRNVYLARHYSAGPDVEEEIIGDDVMEKILNATEACLLICNIYSTAKDLKFLQEDNISTIIKFVQFQFRETIFPSYDSVYTVKNMKKIDNRKRKTPHNHNRSLQLLYSKCVELMKVFVTLFDKCIFVDTIVLGLSTLAIEPFFVDNIETLQFVCLELVTTIFRKEQYVKMRSSILSDILASIDRLPCSKKNLRPFKLASNGGSIQMVTALVLQLIQCATVLPDNICDQTSRGSSKKLKVSGANDDTGEMSGKVIKNAVDKDVIVLEKYDTALSIGGNFLTTFLSKCKSRSNETDFRPLFENFIHDLLATVNRPEWPAAELLLSLLGTLLVKYMSDKTIEQSIRLASLDYLGIVAARLRKDTVESRCKVNIMDQMIKCIKAEQEKEGDLPQHNSNIVLDPEEERTEFLQKILIDFLAVNAHEENLIWDYARHFYLAQWYRDVMKQRKKISDGEKGYASRKKKFAKKKKRKDEESGSSSDEEDEKSEDEDETLKSTTNETSDQALNLEIFQVLEERKKYLLGKIKPYSDVNCTSQQIRTYIDYNNAHLIAQYLASKRPFSQSFDKYLQKIILIVREPAIGLRTRAMKCLANIVEVDPLILKRKDMQMGVNQKFLDTAISVREAAVDLIGKYVLSSEELIDQYYEMLSTRILDTGVSVRKRVIKILRDICIEYPDFQKIPEICVKMIRRVNDEEGIQKLVTEVFMKMWFTPCKENDKVAIYRKINQIIDVVNTSHDTGTTWLDGLLNSIFTPKETNNKLEATGSSEVVKKNTEPSPEVVLACQQLADGLVERLIELEDTDNTRMLGCITTIHLLAKVRPQLLVRHAITIEPYLNIKCHSTNAPKFICSVAEILEQVVPLMDHPSDSFLADLEEHLMILVVSLNQTVVLSCLSCLGAVVNKITKNYKLIRDCFSKFYNCLYNSKEQLINNPNLPIDNIYQPLFRRSLYTIGILMRYFDFKSPKILGLDESGDKISTTICDEIFDTLMYFVTCPNFEIRKQALVSMGHFCVQNDEYLTRPELRDFYRDLLLSSTVESHIKLICMRNIWMYLTESEIYMHNREKDWHTQAQTEDLKEMNDVSSGMASRIIQLYLQEIFTCFLHSDSAVRLWAVKVIQIVLRQGLVHPVRMVPYLICLSTDIKQEIAHRADALLKDIDKTYSGFVNMKLHLGLQLSFQLQEILQRPRDIVGASTENIVIRGYIKKENQPVSLNDFLYTLLRNTKPQRRALVQTVIKQFDDQKTTLRQMLYLADNLAYFPYMVQDEPLYLIHQIDILVSVTGTNLLATFKEGLKPISDLQNPLEDDDDEEDKDVLFNRLPENTKELQQCITSAQGCMLLLILKQHLKEIYGITDGKISRYSPSESQKIYEKAVTKKQVHDFNPKSTIAVIKNANNFDKELDETEKRDLIDKYLDFKQLMLRLDPDDVDSQDEEMKKLNNSLTGTPKTPATNNTSTDNLQKEYDSSAATPHVNNINNAGVTQVVPQKDATNSTPTTRNTKSSSTNKNASVRKQPPRSRRKKRKIISSDEEDTDYSDTDYV